MTTEELIDILQQKEGIILIVMPNGDQVSIVEVEIVNKGYVLLYPDS